MQPTGNFKCQLYDWRLLEAALMNFYCNKVEGSGHFEIKSADSVAIIDHQGGNLRQKLFSNKGGGLAVR